MQRPIILSFFVLRWPFKSLHFPLYTANTNLPTFVQPSSVQCPFPLGPTSCCWNYLTTIPHNLAPRLLTRNWVSDYLQVGTSGHATTVSGGSVSQPVWAGPGFPQITIRSPGWPPPSRGPTSSFTKAVVGAIVGLSVYVQRKLQWYMRESIMPKVSTVSCSSPTHSFSMWHVGSIQYHGIPWS